MVGKCRAASSWCLPTPCAAIGCRSTATTATRRLTWRAWPSTAVEVGRLLEGLESLGLSDDVVIVFTSDHGEEFLDHGEHFHGTSTYGELINVPLMLHWPGTVPAKRVANVVQMIDLMPTLLDLRLAGMIAEWQKASLAVKLTPAADAEMSPEKLEKLRALGYVN